MIYHILNFIYKFLKTRPSPIVNNKIRKKLRYFQNSHCASSFIFSLLGVDIYYAVKPQKYFILITLASEIFVNSSPLRTAP
jgi:hypothetical protein